MSRSLSVIGGFFVRALLWLIPSLVLWYWLRAEFVVPPAWLAEQVMLQLFPSWVLDVRQDGLVFYLDTIIPFTGPGAGSNATVSVPARPLSYAYGFPLLLAMLAAARTSGLWWKIPLALLVLIPFQAWGVCFAWLVQVAVHIGEMTRATTGFTAAHTNVIAIGYQLGYLLLPTLAPMLLWLYLERRFVTTVAVEGALSGMLRLGN